MKSKTILIILIIPVLALLAAYYFLGTGLVKQRHNNEVLASQITEKSDELAKALKPSQDLDARLAETEENLDDAISSIPTDLKSTLVINDILKLAQNCQITAIPLTAGPWTEGNKGYHVFKISMSISGSFLNIHSFLDQLENVEFKTIIIEGLNVNREVASSAVVEASLDLAIYSRYTPAT